MTALGWIGAAVLDFGCSMAAFVVAVHFDLEGRWERRRIERGRKLDARAAAVRLGESEALREMIRADREGLAPVEPKDS